MARFGGARLMLLLLCAKLSYGSGVCGFVRLVAMIGPHTSASLLTGFPQDLPERSFKAFMPCSATGVRSRTVLSPCPPSSFPTALLVRMAMQFLLGGGSISVLWRQDASLACQPLWRRLLLLYSLRARSRSPGPSPTPSWIFPRKLTSSGFLLRLRPGRHRDLTVSRQSSGVSLPNTLPRTFIGLSLKPPYVALSRSG